MYFVIGFIIFITSLIALRIVDWRNPKLGIKAALAELVYDTIHFKKDWQYGLITASVIFLAVVLLWPVVFIVMGLVLGGFIIVFCFRLFFGSQLPPHRNHPSER